MAEAVERVANLEGRFDAQAGELVRVRDAVGALDEKVDLGASLNYGRSCAVTSGGSWVASVAPWRRSS